MPPPPQKKVCTCTFGLCIRHTSRESVCVCVGLVMWALQVMARTLGLPGLFISQLRGKPDPQITHLMSHADKYAFLCVCLRGGGACAGCVFGHCVCSWIPFLCWTPHTLHDVVPDVDLSCVLL